MNRIQSQQAPQARLVGLTPRSEAHVELRELRALKSDLDLAATGERVELVADRYWGAGSSGDHLRLQQPTVRCATVIEGALRRILAAEPSNDRGPKEANMRRALEALSSATGEINRQIDLSARTR